MKFTDEELSRILSAHANGELRRYGFYAVNAGPGQKCCIVQAAIGVDEYDSPQSHIWGRIGPTAIHWFDHSYNNGWPLNKFLRELEKQGLA